MKKIIKLLVIFSLSLVTLTGCANDKEKNDTIKSSTVKTITNKSDNSKTTSIVKSKSSGNEGYNLLNSGKVDVSDGWIYYALEDGIYRCKEDGTNKERLYDGSTRDNHGYTRHMWNINVIDDWIYFDYYGLNRMKIDGSNFEQLSSTDQEISIVNGSIYESTNKLDIDFSNKINLIKKKCNISEKEIVSNVYVTDKNICFSYKKDSGDFGIMITDLDGNKIKNLKDEYATESMILEGKWIYYISEMDVKRISINGKKRETVVSKNGMINNLIVKGNRIYYSYSKKICSCDLDGKNEKIINQNVDIDPKIQLHGDYLYFYVDEYTLYRVKTNELYGNEFASTNDEVETKKLSFCNDSKNLKHFVRTEYSKDVKDFFPNFKIKYPSNWWVYDKSFDRKNLVENIILKNDKGTTIEFTYYINENEDNMGSGSSYVMARVEAKKLKKIKFRAKKTQGEDYSNLGDFVISKIKTTGEMDKYDSDFRDFDGPERIVIIPSSKLGTNDDARRPDQVEYGFFYGGCISVIATPSNESNFTEQEVDELIRILSTFEEI